MTEWVRAKLDDAVNRDALDEVAAYLASGGDPNLRDTAGDPLVISAAWIGSPRMVTLLLEAGADPRLRGCDGRTALERLVMNDQYWDVGHDEVKRILEEAMRTA